VLAWDPKILVLDEPTIGQDYYQKEKLRHFITELNKQGRTIIIVTHDVEFVADCSPRILLMLQSQIISDGDARNILTDSELARKASIILPQIAELFKVLSPLGLPQRVLNVQEAQQILGQVLKS
jgi:energy-coupling factor transport system ATP-binding protein